MIEGDGFRRKLTRGILLTFILALTVLLGVGIWRGRERQEQQSAPLNSSFEADMKLTDMEYTEMELGQRLWTIRASEARFFEKEQRTLLSAVRLVFYLKDGNEVHLASKEGILYAGTKDIELWGDLRASTPQGYELASERAFYRHSEQTISSETPVRVSGADLKLSGKRWWYLISEQKACIEGQVAASLVLMPDGEQAVPGSQANQKADASMTQEPGTAAASSSNGQTAASEAKPLEAVAAEPEDRPATKPEEKSPAKPVKKLEEKPATSSKPKLR
jgi:LPS export ABC transporter protein LptC